MKRAMCPGSFDPLHNGHVDVIARASRLADEVIVVVAHNPQKQYRFSLSERRAMVEETFQALIGIRVEAVESGLLVDYCHRWDVQAIVKGIRTHFDYQYEQSMAAMNWQLGGVETLFLAGECQYTHLSSSLLMDIARNGGDISSFVPRAVMQRLQIDLGS